MTARSAIRSPTRLAVPVFIALALLVPRVAPAFAWALDGHRSVVLCTGTGLVRVTVAEDGSTVDPGAPAEPGRHVTHCDLVATPRCDVERRWTAFAFAPDATSLDGPVEPPNALPHRWPGADPARGPPAAG